MIKKTQKILFLILIFLLVTALPACQNPSGIPIDTDQAQSVSIYYGSICYSLYSEDAETIQKVASLFQGFSLKEVPDGALDLTTAYQIYFTSASEQICAINVDKNGMFYLPDTKQYYKIADGTFHLEELKKIYEDSMGPGTLDKNQCLIP